MAACLPDSIRSRLSYVLAKAHHRQIALFEAYTASLQVTSRDYAVLLVLEAHDRLWQSEIASALGLDRTTVTYLVDALEQRGWVKRMRDPADRRAHAIGMTGAGAAALAGIKPAVEAATKEMLAPLSEMEQDQLRALLTRLIAE